MIDMPQTGAEFGSLTMVSIHSSYGSESKTMPPPVEKFSNHVLLRKVIAW